MKPIRLVLSLALAGATLAAVPALQSTAAGQPASAKPTIVDRMKGEADGAVRISTQRATGEIGMIRTTGDLMPGREGATRADAVAKATSYVHTYAAAFGAPAAELRQTRVDADRYGYTVRYEQRYQGLPVFGSRLLANVDKAGDLTSVNGFVAPDLRLSTQPSRSARTAARTAVALVRLDPPVGEDGKKADTRGLKAVSPKLLVYRMGAIKGEAGRNLLAYQVEVTNGERARHGLHRRPDRQARQPLLPDRRRPRAASLRGLRHEGSSGVHEGLGRGSVHGDPDPGPAERGQRHRQRLLVLPRHLRPRLLRRRGSLDDDGQQRPQDQLPQRQLERPDDELLHRREL